MTQLRSYTTFEQSKKLAEILPLESADYFHAPDAGIVVTEPYKLNEDDETVITAYKGAIPCWSLAALLSVIPYNITFNKAVYRFKLVKFSDHWECYHENFGTVSTDIFKADNPLDACYKMILKLHEQNLI